MSRAKNPDLIKARIFIKIKLKLSGIRLLIVYFLIPLAILLNSFR